MADTYVAVDADRLPWLTDDVERPKRAATTWVVAFLAASSVAIIAALSFWLGMSGALKPASGVETQPKARIELPPPPTSLPNEPVLQPEPVMPQIEPAPVPAPVVIRHQEEVRIAAASRERKVVHRAHRAKASTPKTGAAAKAPEKTFTYSNPWKSDGVSGRMVRIGPYGNLGKGKQAWSQLAQLSPSFKRLPAVVTDLPSRTGRVYYWLQVGTTSQAHSEVLCQRMRGIGQSCLVVDLAGARKGNGNERQPVGI